MSRLVLIGSGETAPTMVRVHRELLADLPDGSAVLLDTPFAFQTNRLDLVTRIRRYFAESVGREVEVVHWPPLEDDAMARERALAQLEQASWLFAGPGSPTYALRHWRDTSLPAAVESVVRRGGTVVLGSAGAVTAGALAVPVYEIYKAGEDPSWLDGLNLLGALAGLQAAVLPHFDNREGGHYDTRFCYLGETRLLALETQLPPGAGVLGVDEHTAAVLDAGTGTLSVLGSGTVSLRTAGRTVSVPRGRRVPLTEVAVVLAGSAAGGRFVPGTRPPASGGAPPACSGASTSVGTSLRDETDAARAAFEQAAARRDGTGCAAAVLAIEEALVRWSSDTLQSADAADARRVLRALVVRLGRLAEQGLADPADVIAPYIDLLLRVRARAREGGDFAAADAVRDALTGLGVQVRDTASGTDWFLAAG